MHALIRLTPVLLLLAPIACGDDKSDATTEQASTGPGGSSSTTGGGTETGVTVTGEPDTTEDPMPTTGTPTTAGESTGTTNTETTSAETTSVETSGTETTSAQTDSTGSTGPGDTGVMPVDCAGDKPLVLIATSLGDMVVELDAVNAPITVANFIEYVDSGFFDGTIFHRVIDNFVMQGGGYTPGMQEKPTMPPIALETSPALKHVDGAIAMARTNDPNSATSQFYICDGPQAFLDGQYAAFGVLVDGFAVRDAIMSVPVQSVGPFEDVPVEDVVITMAYCVSGF